MEEGRQELVVAPSVTPVVHNITTGRLILILLIGAALALHLLGIQRDLPFTSEIDEPQFVRRAVNIAATGDYNPGWFGSPGSMIIYPLAGIYHLWNAALHGGTLLGADSGLQSTFESNGSEFYLLGRLLTIFYAVATVPVIYLIGRRVFGERAGLIASGLFVLYPIAVTHAQMVRTDSAAAFFGALGLWLCLRLYDQPTARNRILAGLVIGLAISTRYFMVALIPVLAAVELLVLWRQVRSRELTRLSWLHGGLGLTAVAAAFAITTPYFFLDFTTAWGSVNHEARGTHLGADGLSRSENFIWYMTEAIPDSITWTQTMLAALGAVLVAWRRQPQQILLAGLAAIFLVGVSLSRLHWQRWLIPILPLLALLVGHALNVAIGWLSAYLKLRPAATRGLALLIVLLVSIWPAHTLVLQDIRQATPSTRILAREWLLQNLPAGSRIAKEAYTAPLDGKLFVITQHFSLGPLPLEKYVDDGHEYIIVSEEIYGRYFAERSRYPSEVSFYETLFADWNLLQKFEPSNTRGGSEIRIYRIDDLPQRPEQP